MSSKPIEYSEELAVKICERIATSSDGLRTICEDEGMPSVTSIFKWMGIHPSFAALYARARESQADFLAEEIIEISDDGRRDYKKDEDGNEVPDYDHIQRSKLRVDARKWVASKLKPKKYGEKVDVTSDGEKVGNVTFTLDLGSKEINEHKPTTAIPPPDGESGR